MNKYLPKTRTVIEALINKGIYWVGEHSLNDSEALWEIINLGECENGKSLIIMHNNFYLMGEEPNVGISWLILNGYSS